MRHIVYTSLDTFKLKHQQVRPYTELGEYFVEWVSETAIKLLTKRNEAELMAGTILRQYINEVHEQVFFRIDKHPYFLDYYLPKYKIAIEIDGGYHRARMIEDKERDRDFAKIGIRTIRIDAKDVLKGNFINTLRKKLQTKKKKRKKKNIKKNFFKMIIFSIKEIFI